MNRTHSLSRASGKKTTKAKSVVSVPFIPDGDRRMKSEVTNNNEISTRSDDDISTQRSSLSSEYSDTEFSDDGSHFSSSCQSSSATQSSRGSTHSITPDQPNPNNPEQKLIKAERAAAKNLVRKNEQDDAIKELIRVMALTRIVYGDKHWKLAASYVGLAQAYIERKDYCIQAEYHAERARNLMSSIESKFQENEPEKLQIYSTLLKIHHVLVLANTSLKKYSLSENYLEKAQKIFEKMSLFPSYSQVDQDLWKIKLSLASARLSQKQKRFSESSTKYKEAIEIIKKVHGKESVHTIPVYQEWAKLEQSKRKNPNHELAIEILQQAHSVATANFKDEDEELIDSALALARAYAKTRKEEAAVSAESYMRECLASCISFYGKEHAKTLSIQDELVRILIQTHRHQEALDLLQSIICVKSTLYGEYSGPVADSLNLMAAVHLAESNLELALKAYLKCYDIQNLMLGTKHQKTRDLQRNIDILRANPVLAGKMAKKEELKSRPRFSNYTQKK